MSILQISNNGGRVILLLPGYDKVAIRRRVARKGRLSKPDLALGIGTRANDVDIMNPFLPSANAWILRIEDEAAIIRAIELRRAA